MSDAIAAFALLVWNSVWGNLLAGVLQVLATWAIVHVYHHRLKRHVTETAAPDAQQTS